MHCAVTDQQHQPDESTDHKAGERFRNAAAEKHGEDRCNDGVADELGLTLDLNWLELAAAMANRDADGKIIYTESEMAYESVDKNAIGNDPYKNISGAPANALVAILKAVLTESNVAVLPF